MDWRSEYQAPDHQYLPLPKVKLNAQTVCSAMISQFANIDIEIENTYQCAMQKQRSQNFKLKSMNYISTKKNNEQVSFKQAVTNGLSENGGLYFPETIPQLLLRF